MLSGVTVPQVDKAGRGGFMRRFLTLVCLLCLAIPAGISISGCTRNPDANYCNGAGYGMKITDVASITLQPVTTGISMAFGQTRQVSSPSALTCKGATASAGSYTYGTTNNQLVDISPAGSICAGTWNRNSGGGIPNYTVCSAPNPLPSTGNLPYAAAYISASAQGVTSNPVEVFIHAPVTSVGLVTEPVSGTAQQCFSQGTAATLDGQACYSGTTSSGASGSVQLCAPSGVTQCPYAASDPRCGNSSLYFVCSGGMPLGVTSVPNCTASLGTLNYSVGTAAVASITTNTTTNQVAITAEQPGTTAITASVAGTGSSAGYFSTCPPKSISVTLANGTTSGIITQGATQNLTTIITDTKGNTITGLALTYQSTDPIDISTGSAGSVTTSFPGVASVYAVCQPPGCNPAPINEIGIYGTGLPVASNAVTITTPGTASDYAWFSAPGQSQYVIPIQLLTGTVGSTIRLPYVPNSMVMDQLGNNLYFGSPHELMVYSTSSGAVTTQTTAVPGVVLAVSPNNTQVLINDQVRQVFYIYNVAGGSSTTIGGMGNAAAWTPDSQTLYITDNASLNNAAEGVTGHTDTLYVYNANTGWTTYALPPSSLSNPLPPGVLPPKTPSYPLPGNVAISSTMQTPAIVIPSMGAFFRGDSTVDHTWCPTGTVGNFASMAFYPQPLGDSVTVENDALAATTDGKHILGATVTGSSVTVNDIGVNIPTAESPADILTPISCPLTTNSSTGVQTLAALSVAPALDATYTLNTAEVSATAVNQVVASPESNLAFITYTADATNTAAYLPYYVPGTGVGYVKLVTQTGGTAPIAPLAGAFTPDDSLFFVSTAGDNMIHYISVPLATSNPATADTQQISPNLPSCISVADGGTDLGCTYSGPSPGTAIVPATAIAVKPRSTT
jgi:sugar lactone lactonase YvrE